VQGQLELLAALVFHPRPKGNSTPSTHSTPYYTGSYS